MPPKSPSASQRQQKRRSLLKLNDDAYKNYRAKGAEYAKKYREKQKERSNESALKSKREKDRERQRRRRERLSANSTPGVAEPESPIVYRIVANSVEPQTK